MSFAAWTMFGLFFLWSFLGMSIGNAMLASAVVYLLITGQDIGTRGHPEHERPLRQLRPARRAALHPRRRDHERLAAHRADVRLRRHAGRPLQGRAGAGQHRRQRYLLRHERLGAGRRRRPRQARGRGDGQGRLCPRLRRRPLLHLRHHRPDHPALDPDGALRGRLRHLDRLPLHGRRPARPAARRRPGGAGRLVRPHPRLSAGAAAQAARGSQDQPAVRSGAQPAGDPARRHLLRRGDAHRGRGGRSLLRPSARLLLVPHADHPAILPRARRVRPRPPAWWR